MATATSIAKGITTYKTPTPTTAINNTAYTQATETANKAEATAMPSAQSLDTASARVRARLAGQAAGQRRTLGQSLAGRGVADSGIARYANLMQAGSEQSALGSGLADVQDDYWNKQQEGSKILGDLAQTRTGIGNSINEQILANQTQTNEFQIAEQKAAEERRKNIMDTLLATGSLFGQYGKTKFDETRKTQWEALLKKLTGLSSGL